MGFQLMPVMHTYLVKTRHSRVAERMVNCCDNADWDFCMARWRSFWSVRSRDRQIALIRGCSYSPDRHFSRNENVNSVFPFSLSLYLQTYFGGTVWPASSWGTPGWTSAAVEARKSRKERNGWICHNFLLICTKCLINQRNLISLMKLVLGAE